MQNAEKKAAKSTSNQQAVELLINVSALHKLQTDIIKQWTLTVTSVEVHCAGTTQQSKSQTAADYMVQLPLAFLSHSFFSHQWPVSGQTFLFKLLSWLSVSQETLQHT